MRFNTDGSVDTTFGSNGRVLTGIAPEGYWDSIADIELQADGRIVAAGQSDIGMTYTASGNVGGFKFSMARYNSDGSLDASFGTGGTLYTEVPDHVYGRIMGVEVLASGKIVAGGSAYSGGIDRVVLARYNSNGSLDATFGTGGLVSVAPPAGTQETLDDIAVLADGRILATGNSYTNATGQKTFVLLRFNADGSPDATFGTGGRVISAPLPDLQITAQALALLPDGRFLVGGGTNNGDVASLLVRYNSDGSLDTSFDGDGIVAIDSTANPGDILTLAVQADGDIIAAGRYFVVMRLNSDGSLDGSFGAGGITSTNFPGTSYPYASSAKIQANGSIVIGGFAYSTASSSYVLARYNGTPVVLDTDDDGVLDSSDQCPGTASGAVINGTGCAIAQYCPCSGPTPGTAWNNHGAYVSCVSHRATLFEQAGLISGAQHGAIVSAAASSGCGK